MSERTAFRALAKQSAALARGYRVSRLLRLLAVALLVTLVLSLFLIIPSWISSWPRPLRRASPRPCCGPCCSCIATLFITAFLGTPILGWLLARSWREHGIGLKRGFLLSLGCVVSLPLLEIGSMGGAPGCTGFRHCRPGSRTHHRGISDRRSRGFECGWGALPALAVAGPNRGVAASTGHPGPPGRVRNPRSFGASLEMQHHALAALSDGPTPW